MFERTIAGLDPDLFFLAVYPSEVPTEIADNKDPLNFPLRLGTMCR